MKSMAWCKASSLTAAVAAALKGTSFPASRAQILSAARGKVSEGWDVSYFLTNALTGEKYASLRSVMSDLEDWLEEQA